MISSSPPDLYSTFGTGSGSGSAAAASSAAILGVALLPSADQPAASRMLTKRNSALAPALCATSLNSGASWVQATSSSASPSEPCSRAISLRHSSVCTVSGAADFNAAASAPASSAIVLLQLHSFSVLCWIAIVFCAVAFRAVSRRLLRCFLRLRLLLADHQVGEPLLCVLQLRQHLFGDRLRLGVVVDVSIEPVHDVEARIREELFQ